MIYDKEITFFIGLFYYPIKNDTSYIHTYICSFVIHLFIHPNNKTMVITQIPPLWFENNNNNNKHSFNLFNQMFFFYSRTDRDDCYRCHTSFSAFTRKHHCRACGETFCSICSSKQCSLHEYGIEDEVRVCVTCYDRIQA